MKQTADPLAPAADEAGHGVPAIRRTLAVFDLLAHARRSLSLSEISRRLELPKSSVYRILVTLEDEDCVRRNPGTGRFSLGTKLLAFSRAALEGPELREQAMPFLTWLRQKTGLTVHMAILEHWQAVLVAKLEPPDRTVGTWIGRAMDLNSTAAGKALIAYLPADALPHQLDAAAPFVRHNDHTIVSMARLREELARVRECGYSMDNEEDELGVRCVGAPVRVGDRVAAAVSVAGFLDELKEERVGFVAGCVRRAAAAIAARLSSV